MTSVIVVVGIIGIVLTYWNAFSWYRFVSDYRFHGEFPGKRYDCNLRFANSEQGTLCFIGADDYGLYLLSHPELKKSWWNYGYRIAFKKNLQIPWSDLNYRAGKMFFQDCMWFDLRSRKIHFYVPKEIGDKVLLDARREVPARS